MEITDKSSSQTDHCTRSATTDSASKLAEPFASTVAPALKCFLRACTYTSWNSVRKPAFEKPRFGKRRAIGVLAHRPMLYEELSPLENLRFFARLYDVADASTRIEELLRTVGLWRRRAEPTAFFSSQAKNSESPSNPYFAISA